jgi:hypothetical protein
MSQIKRKLEQVLHRTSREDMFTISLINILTIFGFTIHWVTALVFAALGSVTFTMQLTALEYQKELLQHPASGDP